VSSITSELQATDIVYAYLDWWEDNQAASAVSKQEKLKSLIAEAFDRTEPSALNRERRNALGKPRVPTESIPFANHRTLGEVDREGDAA